MSTSYLLNDDSRNPDTRNPDTRNPGHEESWHEESLDSFLPRLESLIAGQDMHVHKMQVEYAYAHMVIRYIT